MGLSGLFRGPSFACLSVCLPIRLSPCPSVPFVGYVLVFCIWLLHFSNNALTHRSSPLAPRPSSPIAHRPRRSSPIHSLIHSFIVIRSVCIYSCICLLSDACFRKIMCKQTWIKTKKKRKKRNKSENKNMKRKTQNKKQKTKKGKMSNKRKVKQKRWNGPKGAGRVEGDNGSRERERRESNNEKTCKSNLIAWPTTKGNSHCLLFALLLSMLILLTENKFINKYAYNFSFISPAAAAAAAAVAISVSVSARPTRRGPVSVLGMQKARQTLKFSSTY